MKNIQAIIAKLLVFVLIFGVAASSPELVRAAVRVVTNWTNIDTTRFDPSSEIYLLSLFNIGDNFHVGMATDMGGSLWSGYFVVSDNGVDWHIAAGFTSLVRAGDGFFGVRDGQLFLTNLQLQWQEAPLPPGVQASHITYEEGLLRLFHSYQGVPGIMLSRDGNAWYDYRNHLAGDRNHVFVLDNNNDLINFSNQGGYFRVHRSPGFTEATNWTEIPGMAVRGNVQIMLSTFTGSGVAVQLYALDQTTVNWGDWDWEDAPPWMDGFYGAITLASGDLQNWTQTGWWGGPEYRPVADFSWDDMRWQDFPRSWGPNNWNPDRLEIVWNMTQQRVVDGVMLTDVYVYVDGGSPQLTRIFLNGNQVNGDGTATVIPLVGAEPDPEVEPDIVTEPTPDIITEPMPLIPLTPVVGVQPSAHNILLNGEVIDLIAYNIGGNNFFMLRDVAYALNGTGGQFEVAWDAELNAINLATGQAYTPVGGEMSGTATENVVAHPTTADIFIDGTRAYLRAYNILGNNFFMLRNLGEGLGFIVDWDPDTASVIIIS